MNDFAQLAQQAVAVLAPYLSAGATAAASSTAGGFLNRSGERLCDWLTERFKGKPAAVNLEQAMQAPASDRRLTMLRMEIEEAAERDPEFFAQLTALLREIAPAGDVTQSSSQTGDYNKSVQATGQNIKINMG